MQFVTLASLMKEKAVKGEVVAPLPLPNPENCAWFAHFRLTGELAGRPYGVWTLTNAGDVDDEKAFTDSRDFAREAVCLLNLA